MFHIILFGPPGSGKGTQSEMLIVKYGLKHLSTGNLLRDEISKKSILGIEAKKFIDIGQLVPDEIVIGMISSELDAHRDTGFLFDGFPRTQAQAEALDKLLKFKNSEIGVFLFLNVSEEELVRRLLNRGLTSGRTDDINEEIVKARINEYRIKTAVVADYYRQFNKVVIVKGEGTVNEVFNALCKEIDARISRK